jgi:UPF0716 protein FxsA
MRGDRERHAGQAALDLQTPTLADGRHTITLKVVFFLSALLFIGAEIASFVLVAGQIGFLWALAILIVVSALGPFVVRSVGVGVVGRTQEKLARGELPTWELLDGLVILLGGALICVPGFISDVLGLLLMVGPLRRLVIRTTGHRLARRVQTIPLRWRVVNTRSQPVPDHSSPPLPPPGHSLGPGDDNRF